ncbi:hypothetical protein LUZ61_010052 [Rhynchospora tenuis]|uniref:Uncharacterized protein n=1 Tax=Rhynchospora tenuis TaxID=198213 RepID=A0AAD6EYV8_9POAL|nr:hypothetical protein LUZ61_010052 [Rhynchospora tenuis]
MPRNSSMAKPNLHVVLFPFPAHGHISPHLNLAARLHQYHSNLTITLVSTPHNIAVIRSSLHPTSRLQLHSLPFRPADHGLQTDSESTEDLPSDQFENFFFSRQSPSAQPLIILSLRFPSNLPYASSQICSWGVHSTLLGTSAFGGAVYLSLLMNLPHNYSDSDPFTLPEYPELSTLYKTDAVLINTSEYLDLVGLVMLKKTLNLPVIPIGPLVGSPYSPILSSENECKIIECHKSIGAFLSHCGWNSVLESLNSGVPIIGWPLGGDQPFNVTILVKLGVCVEVARGNLETSEVEKEKVADAVQMVMSDNEKGRDMREKAKEISKMLKGEWKDESCSSAKGLAEFLKLIETVNVCRAL